MKWMTVAVLESDSGCFGSGSGSGPTLKPPTLKDGRRPLSTDEYHRSSYKPRNLPALGRGPPLAGVGGELFHLVPVSMKILNDFGILWQ